MAMIMRGAMVKEVSLQSLTVDSFDIQNKILGSAFQSRIDKPIDDQQLTEPTSIFLKLGDLKCFEVVNRQYEKQGVIFNNCIAIHPSNPAFPAHSSSIVLMAAPKSGFLEATFVHPVNFVSALVTSSERLILSAYDRDCLLLAQTQLPEANLANSNSPLEPNTSLSISAKDIRSISFYAFDGQFTISDFSFC
jgi:hypothetical protein